MYIILFYFSESFSLETFSGEDTFTESTIKATLMIDFLAKPDPRVVSH